MGFIKYYNSHKAGSYFYWDAEICFLPSDVQEDLNNLLMHNDKRIGIGHFKDSSRAIYYVRTKLPDIVWHEIWIGKYIIKVPCGLRFWRMRKNAIL